MKKLILTSTILALSVFLSACNTAANKAAQKENANQTQKELSAETQK